MQVETIVVYSTGVIFVLITVAIGIILCFKPKSSVPPEAMYFFRGLMSLGGAGFAVLLTGLINVNFAMQNIRIAAGGAFAVFVIFYLVNPPKLIGSGDETNILDNMEKFTKIATVKLGFMSATYWHLIIKCAPPSKVKECSVIISDSEETLNVKIDYQNVHKAKGNNLDLSELLTDFISTAKRRISDKHSPHYGNLFEFVFKLSFGLCCNGLNNDPVKKDILSIAGALKLSSAMFSILNDVIASNNAKMFGHLIEKLQNE
jgi:hypothetical protein